MSEIWNEALITELSPHMTELQRQIFRDTNSEYRRDEIQGWSGRWCA